MNKKWMDEISGTWRSFVWKIFVDDERKSVSDLCKIDILYVSITCESGHLP